MPIRSVTPCDRHGNVTGTTITDIPCPAHNGGYQWSKEDIHDETAGRPLSGDMVVKRIGRVVKIGLEWRNVDYQTGSKALSAFQSEYSKVEFLDAEHGGYITRVFYTGGRKAALYNHAKGLWSSISFNIIQAITDKE